MQAQLDAYNRGDIEAFLASYAPDVRIYDHPDRLLMSGVDEMRQSYGPMFEAAPDLHAEIGGRIVHGEYVIDLEIVSGMPGRAEFSGVAVYQVRDGRIQNVWFID